MKNLCFGLLQETPTVQIPRMIFFKRLTCYNMFIFRAPQDRTLESRPLRDNALGLGSAFSLHVNGVCARGCLAGIRSRAIESRVINDLKEAIDCVAPENIHYEHNGRWGEWYSSFFVRSVRELSA